MLFRLSHKRTYFFWPVCCRVLFRLHQVYFFNVCHCFFRLFFFLHGRVRVVVATWATLVGCSCSTSMLSYALLACLLLFYLHSFPAIVKIIEFVFFFPCFVLSLSFFPLLLVFLHQSFDVIFSRLLLSLFSMLCSHYFPPPSSSLLCMWSGFTVYLTLWTTAISFASLLASLCSLGFVLVFLLIFYAIFKAGRYVMFNIFFFAFAGGNLIMQS